MLKALTPEERQKKMQEMREALKTWAKTAGIELGFVMPEVGENGQGQRGEPSQDDKGGKGQGGMKRPSGTPKPIPTEAE